MNNTRNLLFAGLVAASTITTQAWAQESPKKVEVAPVDTNNPFGTKTIDPAALSRQRGGTDTGPVSDMKLNGVVSNNNASNLSTGNNLITDGAFTGVNGVPLVVQNSGNNVLIQSATIINVQLK